jgi:hypothetical protein
LLANSMILLRSSLCRITSLIVALIV